VYAGYQAYKVRNFASIQDLKLFREDHLQKEAQDTELVLADTKITVAMYNQTIIDDKAAWTEGSVKLLIGQAVLITLLIIVQVGAIALVL
jgi:hypothetical protein